MMLLTMKLKIFIVLAASVFLAFPLVGGAQEQEQTVPQPERHSFIELFRPIYLNTGIPVTEKPAAENSNVKFQVSFALPLWRNMRGSGIDLLMAYTQISIWSLFAYSSPFYDNTYIPGIYARKQWMDPDGLPAHSLMWGLEHRSNGRNDAYSRSVNYALLTYARSFRSGLTLEATARLGYSWYGDQTTFDVNLRYFGFVQGSLTYVTPSGGWEFMLSATPLWNRSIANVNAEIGRRIGKKHNNPYFFIQFHYGYDEAFRDCMDSNGPVVDEDGKVPYYHGAPIPPRAMVRAGLILTPHNFMRGNL